MFPSGKDAPLQRAFGEGSASAGVVVRTSLSQGGKAAVALERDCLELTGTLATSFLAHFTKILGEEG